LTLLDFPFDTQRLQFAVRIPRVHRHGIRRVVCADAVAPSALPSLLPDSGPSVVGDLQTMTTVNLEVSDRKERLSIEDAWNVLQVSQRIQHCAPGEENFKPEYVLELALRRRAAFYFSNIAIPNCLLTLLHYCCYLYDTSDMNDRLSVVLTLLLALITLKAAVASFLPILSYETQLDVHTLVNIGLVVATGFACVAVFMLDSRPNWLPGVHLVAAEWLAPCVPATVRDWLLSASTAQLLNAACACASLLVFFAFNVWWCVRQVPCDACRRNTSNGVSRVNVDC
jgi:hypothetical protein